MTSSPAVDPAASEAVATAAETASVQVAARPPGFRLILIGLLMASGLAALESNIVNTALPTIASELNGLNHLSWVVTSFMLAQCASMPLYGRLSDLYGRKLLFVWALAAFIVGSTLCGVAQTLFQLSAFRALQGAGAGGVMLMASAALADVVPPRERGRYQGLFVAVFAAASLIGPAIGGLITQALGWRWVFLINLPLGLIVLYMIIKVLPSASARKSHDIDYAGAGLIVASAVCLLLTLSWGGAIYPWTSPPILALALGTVALALLLIWREGKASEPILPLRLFASRTFSACVLTTGTVGFAFFGAITFLPLYLQLARGLTPAASGLAILPQIAGVVLASTISGFIISKTGQYRGVISTGAVFIASGLFLIGFATQGGHPFWMLEAALFVLGSGGGMCMPNLTVAVQNSVSRADIGVGTSTLSFFHMLASTSGVATAGAVMAARLQQFLEARLPGVDADALLAGGMTAVQNLDAGQRSIVEAAFASAISQAFMMSGAIASVAILVAICLPRASLRAD